MDPNKFSHEEPDWSKLLDQLELDLQQRDNITAAEIKQLEELKSLIAETAGALKIYEQLNIDAGWQSLTQKAMQRNLIAEPQLSKPVTIRTMSRLFAAAAMIILLGVGGYFMLVDRQSSPLEKPTVIAEIQPGGNRATLKLSNGETHVLSEHESGIAVHENGISYTNGKPVSDVSQKISFATLSIPRGGQYQLILPDGSKVWLNAASELTYPTAFTGSQRTVTLKGEAFFDIAHDKDRPFVVRSPEQEVKVLGTQFNVSAYEDDELTRTTLVKGSVQIDAKGRKDNVILKAGMQARLRSGGIEVEEGVNVEDYITWKEGVIVLERQTIAQVLKQLERWYDVEFVVGKGRDLPTKTMSGELSKNLPIGALLKAIEAQLHIKFEQSGRRFMIKY